MADNICTFCLGGCHRARMVFFSGAADGVLICRTCIEHAAAVLADLDSGRPPGAEVPPVPLDDTSVRGRLLEFHEVRRG